MITVKEQIDCVNREISFRKRLYPRWIESGKMSPGKAEYEIKVMESIKDSLMLMPHDQALLKV